MIKFSIAKKHFSIYVCTIILATTTGGCANFRNSLQAQSRVNPVSPVKYTSPNENSSCPLTWGSVADTRKGAIDLDCFTFPNDTLAYEQIDTLQRHGKGMATLQKVPTVKKSVLAYTQAVADKGDRNRLTSILLKHSDDICTTELGRLTANEATTNATLSILGTTFSGAATVVGGDLAKSILSGTATVLGASRDHINVHVYRNTIAQAISQVIANERKTLLTSIQAKYTSDITDWSIDDSIRAVNEYHAQCSFYKGLELLLKAADNNSDLAGYKIALAQRTRLTRLDKAIVDLKAAISSADAADQPPLKTKLAELELERAGVGTGVTDDQ